MRWVGSQEMSDLLAAFAALGRPEIDIRTPYGLANKDPAFITEFDIMTPEQLATQALYTEFLWPRGYGWCAGTCVKVPSGDQLLYTFERRYDDGPFDAAAMQQLDALRPHLARAAVLSGRLQMERARAATEMLNVVGLPAAVLSLSHRVTSANALFETLMPDVVRDGNQRVAFRDPGVDVLLARALSQRNALHTRSIPIAANEAYPPMIAHLVPIRLAARDIFFSASEVLLITPVSRRGVPSADIIEGLFDLTPAESRIARGIAEGGTVQGLAARSGNSPATVRSQLKSVFMKTGISRQADLVSLLAGLHAPGIHDPEAGQEVLPSPARSPRRPTGQPM
jgi:DNA-binding CsgD family transcriptional regulator